MSWASLALGRSLNVLPTTPQARAEIFFLARRELVARRQMRGPMVTRFIGPVLALALLCAWSSAADVPATAPPPLGKMIDLGGYRLHLYCTGKGKRTVVFSNGAGDFSFDWYLVQTQVSRFARACSYDRGGEAWSDLGPKPHTIFQEAHDLGRLLRRAGENGPFIIVGQSAGSTIARAFWQEYPQQVSGLDSVDRSQAD